MEERFGISRVVMREAMRVLSAGGLIQTRPGVGHSVCNRAAEAISETLTLTLLLEPDSVIELVDLKRILENEFLFLIAKPVLVLFHRGTEGSPSIVPEDETTFRASDEIHEAVLEALKSRDSVRARKATSHDFSRLEETLLGKTGRNLGARVEDAPPVVGVSQLRQYRAGRRDAVWLESPISS